MGLLQDGRPGDPEQPGSSESPVEQPDQLAARLRAAQRSGLTRPLAWRRRQLAAMASMLREAEGELLAAMRADFGKPPLEGWLTEIGHVANEIAHIQRHLEAWAAPERVPVRTLLRPARARVQPEPLGVALVIAPWNYPVHLLLLPMAYAIAAGNAVVGKPSEVTPATSAALARLVPRYLDERTTAVVEGGVEETTALLDARWDHIFYTGNGRVGRVVMAAAARHLTPVTLELGGKSPVIVERSADVRTAARRVAWGKYLNAGQTCVAPDYVLVDEEVEQPFVSALAEAVRSFYGERPLDSPDLARIVDDRHFARLSGLLDAAGPARVAVGGARDAERRLVEPTVLTGVGWDDAVMAEEIFGPILPVITVSGVGEAVDAVNAGDKPLALYVFSEDRAVVERVISSTSSGGVGVNCTLLQLAVTDLPFGGVGASGMGSYHGKAGFDTFSHRKAVLSRPARPDPPAMYPPYTPLKSRLLRRLS